MPDHCISWKVNSSADAFEFSFDTVCKSCRPTKLSFLNNRYDRPIRVAVYPYDESLEGNRLFDPASLRNRDDVFRHWRVLKQEGAKQGLDIQTLDQLPNPRVVVSADRLIPESLRAPWIFYIGEPHVVRPDLYRSFHLLAKRCARILTHNSLLASSEPNARHFSYPQTLPGNHVSSFHGPRRLVAMINANKAPATRSGELYSTRVRVASALARRSAIDVYGEGWGNPFWFLGKQLKRGLLSGPSVNIAARDSSSFGGRVAFASVAWNVVLHSLLNAPGTIATSKVWRGKIESKYDILEQYDFCIAFENAVSPGFISEKLFDPMAVGCIPVYLGDPHIEHVVPPEVFIDYRRMKNVTQLLMLLRDMSEGEKESRRKDMRAYLNSETFLDRFSVKAWVRQLLAEIHQVVLETRSTSASEA